MSNCALTFVCGEDFSRLPEVQVYLRSLRTHYQGEAIVFTWDLPEDQERAYERLGYAVCRVPQLPWLVRDRWLVYHNFLAQSNYERVLITDAKDVLFQADPFANYTQGVYLVSEGMTHRSSGWNMRDQMGLRQSLGIEQGIDWLDWPVINGGFQLGDKTKILELSLLLYTNMAISQPHSTEQALLNFLYYEFLRLDPAYQVASPDMDLLCATGEAVATQSAIEGYSLELQDGDLINPNLGKYTAVHQWERTAYRDDILNTWNDLEGEAV